MFQKVGLTVDVVEYRTSRERDAAFAAGELDAVVADPVSVIRLREKGHSSRIVTVCLGVTPLQGRHGLLVAPRSRIRLVAELKDVPIGVSRGTVEEYVLDRLVNRRPRTWQAKRIDVPSPAERARQLSNGSIEAAILPDPYFSVAARSGCRVLISDTVEQRTVSQTVLAVSDAVLARPSGVSAVQRLLGAWDSAVSAVNTDPARSRTLLAERLGLGSDISHRYRMSRFPTHRLPDAWYLDDVSAWMLSAGLSEHAPSYNELVWEPGL